MAKVTFDGINKVIIVDTGITELDAKVDLYSEWKDWVVLGSNANYPQAFRTTGGDPLTGSLSISPYFFLMNGWRIRPHEADHLLTVSGNLFVDEGGNPFISTIGTYNVLVNLQTSVNAVQIETGTSGLTVDESNQLNDIYTKTQKIKKETSLIPAAL